MRFVDIAKQAGIHFSHYNGAAGNKWLPETIGSGCAFTDLDGDGWADIFLLNGKDWTHSGTRHLPALYRNNHNGTFSDVTKGSGLDVEMYANGVAVADYDNDGLPDIYVTALEGDHLFHNEGHGHFKDVTAASGIHNANFGTSAGWFDFDRDGKADLVVANYVQWSGPKDIRCSMDGKTKSYCTPEVYKGESLKLYHNLGNGRFEDVTKKAGLENASSKSLGIVVFDFNGDGWPDLFISNDTQPNKLYRNNKNGTFTEQGVESGLAYAEDGTARGAMGADAADYDRSGHPHLVVGNFSKQMMALYHNDGTGLFSDVASSTALSRSTILDVTFGTFFFDYDLDGFPDIFAVNGHIEPDINRTQSDLQFREPASLFHNNGHGSFEDASNSVGPDIRKPIVGRGAAYADFDHDGDLDVLITENGGPAELLRNDGGNKNNWVNVRLIGRQSNRSGLGAVVRVESASGKQWQTVHSGSSYCSQSDLAITFGLKQDRGISKLIVEWPSGKTQHFGNVPVNRLVIIDESAGLSK
ncbi:MAG: CRTAC1 family protein [Acidobacteriota bacterium]|nr:CRTAC1 family protein [Acidobacteriota bacterium]